MTEQEFLNKYGDKKVKFESYYKYSFTFVTELDDGKTLCVYVGGHPDDIYKFSVSAGGEVTVNSLYPYSGSVYDDGTEIEMFDNY
jgi:hypothetical protein